MRLMLAAVFMSEHYFFLCRHLHFTPWRTSLKHRNTVPHPSWEQPLLWMCTVAKNSNQLHTLAQGWCSRGLSLLSCWPILPCHTACTLQQRKQTHKQRNKPIRKEELHWLVFSEMWVLLWAYSPSKMHFPECSHCDPPWGRLWRGWTAGL